MIILIILYCFRDYLIVSVISTYLFSCVVLMFSNMEISMDLQ